VDPEAHGGKRARQSAATEELSHSSQIETRSIESSETIPNREDAVIDPVQLLNQPKRRPVTLREVRPSRRGNVAVVIQGKTAGLVPFNAPKIQQGKDSRMAQTEVCQDLGANSAGKLTGDNGNRPVAQQPGHPLAPQLDPYDRLTQLLNPELVLGRPISATKEAKIFKKSIDQRFCSGSR
jgi:hypothetical protein